MNQVNHFVIDTETLGIEPSAIITSIAIVHLDFNKPKSFNEYVASGYYAKLNATKQKNQGRTITPSTLDWWKRQSNEAKQEGLYPSEHDIPLEQALTDINTYLRKNGYSNKNSMLWCRGVDFDKPLINQAYAQTKVENLMNIWKWRDTRTFIDCLTHQTTGKCSLFDNEISTNIKHNALYDCCYDAFVMSKIYQEIYK